MAVTAFTSNSRQVCSAGTRLIVERTVHDGVVRLIAELVQTFKPGVQLGPIITDTHYAKVREYLRVAADEGATLEVGGPLEQSDGYYVNPTVYSGVTNQMRIAREEIFGPVLSVIAFDTDDEALSIANDTSYGLVGGVWTENLSRAFRMAGRILAGLVFVNDWTAHVEVPFGGFKQSGYGREKGVEALNGYTRLKSVVIRLT